MVEAALPAVVGVRHAEIIVVAAEAHERLDFGMQFAGLVEALDVREIALIHGHDQVESFQIRRLDLPRLALDGESLLPEGF